MSKDFLLFLGFFGALALYLVISAQTEMGTKLPKRFRKQQEQDDLRNS
ncbi:MAG: hypothetical protein AAFY11_01800 [Cyanobacteria bacterium J06641_5]